MRHLLLVVLLISPGVMCAQGLDADNHPAPTYLPPGFRRGEVRTGSREFRSASTVVTLFYRNSEAPLEIAWSNPIQVFLAPVPAGTFGLAARHDGTPVTLVFTPADTVVATYHDGLWNPDPNGEITLSDGTRLHWKNDVAHSIVFEHAGLAVAILGSRRTGVDSTELVKIAASIR